MLDDSPVPSSLLIANVIGCAIGLIDTDGNDHYPDLPGIF
jgi:hypothetical protein